MVKEDSKTNLTFISFFKLFLREVKVESSWILWGFFWFLDHAHLLPGSDALFLSQVKSLMESHNRGKFHEYTICGSQVINVQMFSDQQKIPFLGPFWWFFSHNFPKYCQILLKFGTVMQIKILHHIYYGFWDSPENSKKLAQKPHFLV